VPPSEPPAPTPGRRATLAERRRERTQEILSTTRAMFDERGLRDAQIEDIANAVGINKAIIYRHFHGKEELFALVLEGYLDDLSEQMAVARDPETSPVRQLEDITGCFFDFGSRHPAFADCALSLMRRTGPELFEEISEEAMTRLGRSIATCLGQVSRVLRAGTEGGVFEVEDPDVLANTLYAQGLGLLQLARVGLLVKESSGDTPGVATVPPEQLRRSMVASAVALARTEGTASR
jgi:AcrR family transcriptional regulator